MILNNKARNNKHEFNKSALYKISSSRRYLISQRTKILNSAAGAVQCVWRDEAGPRDYCTTCMAQGELKTYS